MQQLGSSVALLMLTSLRQLHAIQGFSLPRRVRYVISTPPLIRHCLSCRPICCLLYAAFSCDQAFEATVSQLLPPFLRIRANLLRLHRARTHATADMDGEANAETEVEAEDAVAGLGGRMVAEMERLLRSALFGPDTLPG